MLPKTKGAKRKNQILNYMFFVLPALIIFLSVITIPVLTSFGLSFTKYNIYKNSADWIGLDNYTKMFSDPIFWVSLKNNLIVVVSSIALQIPIGFVLAYILYRKLVRYRLFFQSAVFLPIAISTIVIGILWSKIFSPIGVLPSLLKIILNNPDYMITIFNNKHFAMLPIVIAMVWLYTGFYMIVFLANLQKIDSSILDAAVIDGASEWQILIHIIVPNMAGIITTMIIISIAGSLKSFDLIYAMTQGGPAHYTEVLAIYMYRNSFGSVSNYGLGSAISTIIVILSIVLITITRKIKSVLVEED